MHVSKYVLRCVLFGGWQGGHTRAASPARTLTAEFCLLKTYLQKLCNVMLLIKLNFLTFNAFLYIRLVILLV